MPLAVGKPAPPFTLENDSGERVSLKSLRGTTVVLYFYPKDDTSGCTREACEFRDLFPRFTSANAVILGISPDSVKSHVKFKKKYGLPFTLLADADHEVAERYGLWVEKTFYGRKYFGVERTTCIIGPEGTVEKIFSKVKPEGHAAEVEAALTTAHPVSRRNSPMRAARKGFTLVELLVVVVIIGILASIAIVKFANTKEKAYVASMKSDLRNLVTSQEAYIAGSDSTYAPNVATLGTNYKSSSGVTVILGGVTNTGWAATATHAQTAKTCTISFGGGSTTDGQLICQ